jgi:ankyrin repeat protein
VRSHLIVTGLVAGALSLALAGVAAEPAPSPIADAAMRGDTAAVRSLVAKGADVNAPQGDGMTALHWTALNGDMATLNVLLEAKAAVEPVTRVGNYTPLHLASSRGHGAAVTRLLDAGSRATAVTATGVQPVHFAAQAGSADAVRALLDRGVGVDVRDETHGRTPLVFAVSSNRLETMKVLIDRGADVAAATKAVDYVERSRQDNAERQARDREITASTGRAPVANSGGGLSADPPAGGNPAQAARGRGAGRGRAAANDPDDPDDPDLPQSPRAGRGRGGSGPSAIQQIGRQGGFTALHYAARDGFADAAAMLLDAGLDIDRPSDGDRSTPMLVAILNGQYDLARTFLGRGAKPGLTSDDGVSPLFAVLNNEWALRTWYPQPTAGAQQRTSYLELMEALLEAGADPNARTRSHIWYAAYNTGRMGVDFAGATAFWRAAYALDVEAMRLLVRHGADPNIPTMTFGTAARPNDQSNLPAVPAGGPHVPPFHAASGVGYGTSRVAQQHRTVPDGWMPAAKYFLEELRVDVNMRDADGFTALHHAAARGDNEMILYLVKQGANVLAVNRAGQTTVDMANSPEQRTQPFPETIKLLEGMGAKNNHNCRACGK